jgi:hypothetical protein
MIMGLFVGEESGREYIVDLKAAFTFVIYRFEIPSIQALSCLPEVWLAAIDHLIALGILSIGCFVSLWMPVRGRGFSLSFLRLPSYDETVLKPDLPAVVFEMLSNLEVDVGTGSIDSD